MVGVTHRFIETNHIKMHIAEQGSGSLVVLCHGFPESWYSWRHQLLALSEAGYHVVAPACTICGRGARLGNYDVPRCVRCNGRNSAELEEEGFITRCGTLDSTRASS
jgi:hypothetical protein